jgi:hypothetical protein
MRHRHEQFRRGAPRDCGSLAGRDFDECALVSGGVAQQGRKPALWAAATSLAECAPLVVVGLETIATLAVRMRESPVERRLGNAVGTRLGRTGNPSQLN